MPTRLQQLAAVAPMPGASPGLLRRRYSVPETIMRKYRIAQLYSDTDETAATSAPSRVVSPASPSSPQGSCSSLCEPPHRFMKRDRELMRKSALLRRLWAKPSQCPACCYCSDKDLSDSHCGRESRSLDGSRNDIRHLSSSYTSSKTSKEANVPAGYATPKRQRLETPSIGHGNLHGSNEMLRTAMRNSYDRSEELRHEREGRTDDSVSTYQSHEMQSSNGMSVSSNEVSTSSRYSETDSSETKSAKKRRQGVVYTSSESITRELKPETQTNSPEESESFSIRHTNSISVTSDSSLDTTTLVTTKEMPQSFNVDTQTDLTDTDSRPIVVDVREDGNYSNNDENILVADKDSTSHVESSFEVLEIVVSETLDSGSFSENSIPMLKEVDRPMNTLSKMNNKTEIQKNNFNIDEYVSNILVESLNSLSDQIEVMNASFGNDRKISIVEKEIKVKLQNTGMNTIVHLSPTSNNPIIFGNEELYNKDESQEKEPSELDIKSRNSIHSLETVNNNNESFSMDPANDYSIVIEPARDDMDYNNESMRYTDDNMLNMSTENINKAVLQQIQKLFQEGLDNFDSQMNYPGRMVPEISHIEISNVDVYVDGNMDPGYEASETIEIETDRNCNNTSTAELYTKDEVISKVGTGTYFKESPGPVLVPRFSAFPNTDSMEVNTSSSDDAEAMGSDCTSLVDSLDDPNSPRSMMLRRSAGSRRNELVRSAIDVLDLLPENTFKDTKPREKSESFFIRIRDNDCDCEKENVVVADHMPDQIKERLYRRHKKRELRMEYIKRKKVRQLKRDIDKQRKNETSKSKKEIEKDCGSIVNTLIDEVINKIAEEEYKYMRIKQKSNGKQEKELKSRRKDSLDLKKLESFKISKNGEIHFCDPKSKHAKNFNDFHKYSQNTDEPHVRGKLSLQPRSPITPDNYGPRRIYQKSEIHDGNKCIEILEILEYVDTSQSSAETTNSDENQNHKNRKSRIPIPVYEKLHKIPKVRSLQKSYRNTIYGKSSPNLSMGKPEMNSFIANMLIDALDENHTDEMYSEVPIRRASVPQQDTPRRSNPNRFKQIFDIIPEEKSLSIDSSNEEVNRRVSAPINTSNNNKIIESPKHKQIKPKDTKSAATSPLSDSSSPKVKTKSATTSPLRKTVSAATSPIPAKKLSENQANISTKKSLSSHGTKAGWVGFYKPKISDDEGTRIKIAQH